MTPILIEVRRRAWEGARQQFLVALREMLADRSIPDQIKASEIKASIDAISGLIAMTEDARG